MGLILPLVIGLGGTTALMLYEALWPGVIFMLLVIAFVAFVVTSFRYIIDQNTLLIRGFLFKMNLNIEGIERISPTRTWLAAPAASLDRLKITGRQGCIVVSPAKQADFIHHLQQINPDIKFAQAA